MPNAYESEKKGVEGSLEQGKKQEPKVPAGQQKGGLMQPQTGADNASGDKANASYSVSSTNPNADAAAKYHKGIPSDAVPMRITGNKHTTDGFIHPVKDHKAYYVDASHGWSDKTGNLNTKAGYFTVKDEECSPVDSYQSHTTKQYIRNYAVGDKVTVSSKGRFLKDTSSEDKSNRLEVYNKDFATVIESIEETAAGKFYQVTYHDKKGFVNCRYVTHSAKEIAPEQLEILEQNANNWLGYNTRELANSNSEYSKDITFKNNYSKNCANFVSYQLKSAGILDKVYAGCAALKTALKNKGWGVKKVSKALKEEHLPAYGDVWFSGTWSHTELVTGTENNKVKLIGSNNRDHNAQVVSVGEAAAGDDIYSRFYK